MSRIRTFIAVPLSDVIRKRAVALQEELAAGAKVNWTPPDNLHVTLVFLGEVADWEVPRVCQIAAECVAGMAPFSMEVRSVGCFPNARRPRIVWVGVGAGAESVCRIHDAIEPPLIDLGYRREERKFTPHITLGRIRSPAAGGKLTELITRFSNWQGGEMPVSEIHVMASELTPKGSEYTILGRAMLAGSVNSLP